MAAQMTAPKIVAETDALLQGLGIAREHYSGGTLEVHSPITGEVIAMVHEADADEAEAAVVRAHQAFLAWREVPAPKRGELVRLLGEELRAHKSALGRLVSIEVGKIESEGLGEVQEMIDICDYAVGLSRQIFGLTVATERPNHRMMETWHPLGVTGIITAFNFPVAVWSWNAAIALVCGNACIWKPSEKTPLTALATAALFERAVTRFAEEGNKAPEGLMALLVGGRAVGEVLVDHPKVAVLSATGSTAMGKQVAPKLAKRFARAILELGGNNAGIVCPTADLDLTLRAVAFAAMGTAGQRCTTLRRLFVHESVYDQLVPRLIKAYGSVTIGNPLQTGTLVGPLIDHRAYQGMERALNEAKAAGGTVHGGGRTDADTFPNAYYVHPALVEMPRQTGPVEQETFAPILYVMKYQDFDEALRLHNAVAQSASSRWRARIAASPTSTSAPRVPRSAAPSAARRRPAAAARPARIPGRPTCAAPPTPSTTASSSRWRRA